MIAASPDFMNYSLKSLTGGKQEPKKECNAEKENQEIRKIYRGTVHNVFGNTEWQYHDKLKRDNLKTLTLLFR